MNSDNVLGTISMVKAQIADLERQLNDKKKLVNGLCCLIGQQAMYAAVEEPARASMQVRSDQFYGRALATAVREILEARKAAGLGAASVDEIYTVLIEGNFRFEAKNDTTAKRALAVSLSKNNITFHKLPNGDFGLLEWYPEASKYKNGDKAKREQADEDDAYVNDFAEEPNPGAETEALVNGQPAG